MSKLDPAIEAHRLWLGFAQPVGLVVSPHALVAAQAHPDKNIAPQQAALLRLTEPPEEAADDAPRAIRDLVSFLTDFFGWQREMIAGAPGGKPLPDSLTVAIPDRNEHLRPSYAVSDADDPGRWVMLIEELPLGTDFDRVLEDAAWAATPQARTERLLRDADVPIGLQSNGTHLRLTYRPRGETPGFVTFGMEHLVRVDGRPMVAALHMLLCAERVFTLPAEQRLQAILAASRRYQNTVSTRLAEQVLVALSELLRGFQSADEFTQGQLLGAALREEPGHVYGGLLSTLMRLVFVLYTEDQGLMPTDSVYTEHYSVWKLFEQLREYDALYHDSMDQRYGAWGRLLALFRLIHDGGTHGTLRTPPRGGRLFNPDTYPFLEGRPYRTNRSMGETLKPPHISDGVVFRVLEKLLVLDGERLSYRALDVEQIGSVYEEMMGFVVQVAKAPSLAVGKEHVVVDLQALLDTPGKDRGKRLKELSETDLSGRAATALAKASALDEVEAALERRRSPLTPHRIGVGGLYLQPTDERRRSGSNYTPRTLTQPIVQRALEPILADLGEKAEPEQVLGLKVCDPAMGSGAFLVEACRQLSERLALAWDRHQRTPAIPPDEDILLHARRLVAQQCLYGVDKNPYAVDLAKLSLWLVTFAKEHPFTFLDHALRGGDSLIGLSREQIASFHWEPQKQLQTVRSRLESAIRAADDARTRIHGLGDAIDIRQKSDLLHDADESVAEVQLVGDLCVSAFFTAEKNRDREARRLNFNDQELDQFLAGKLDRNAIDALAAEAADGAGPLRPFHWELEFPEVFTHGRGGFDAVIGNPPFLGGKRISTVLGECYRDWLSVLHEGSSRNADLVAHFFRRAFALLRAGGTIGLIATNTIAQGDTRVGGLRWICTHGGEIYAARRRVPWPGAASVVVSVLHIMKGGFRGPRIIDEHCVEYITAFLFQRGGHDDPEKLIANIDKSFVGNYVLGVGFTFDDTDPEGLATPLAEMHRLIAKDLRNQDVIFPYLGGEEINSSPECLHHRYVINFGARGEAECRENWPELMAIVEEKVRPERMRVKRKALRDRWWQFAEKQPALQVALRGLDRVLVISQTSRTVAFVFVPTGLVYSHKVIVFPVRQYGAFCVLQSRLHDIWARSFGSTMKDDAVYTPSDCFETFPFPNGWEQDDRLDEAGRTYHEVRSELMVTANEGLTKTYNRFHSRNERSTEIQRLRELHTAMDRAVLNAYGWHDLLPTHEFIPDFVEEDDDGRMVEKSFRYRWPDGFRDDVLARLLALNQQRAAEERALAAPAPSKRLRAKHAPAVTRSPSSGTLQLDLPGEMTK